MKRIVSTLFILSFGVVAVFGQCQKKTTTIIHHHHNHNQQYSQNYQNNDRPNRRVRYDRLHLQVGGAGTYLYDQSNETGFDPAPERVDGYAEAMLGIRFDANRRGRRANVLAGWGTVGVLSPQSVSLLLTEQGVAGGVDASIETFQYQEFEAGFLFKEWFRLSGGIGMLEYLDASGAIQDFNYYKLTSGFSIGLTRSIKWNTFATVLMGENGDSFSFRPSTGLSFRFNFLRI